MRTIKAIRKDTDPAHEQKAQDDKKQVDGKFIYLFISTKSGQCANIIKFPVDGPFYLHPHMKL